MLDYRNGKKVRFSLQIQHEKDSICPSAVPSRRQCTVVQQNTVIIQHATRCQVLNMSIYHLNGASDCRNVSKHSVGAAMLWWSRKFTHRSASACYCRHRKAHFRSSSEKWETGWQQPLQSTFCYESCAGRFTCQGSWTHTRLQFCS